MHVCKLICIKQDHYHTIPKKVKAYISYLSRCEEGSKHAECQRQCVCVCSHGAWGTVVYVTGPSSYSPIMVCVCVCVVCCRMGVVYI